MSIRKMLPICFTLVLLAMSIVVKAQHGFIRQRGDHRVGGMVGFGGQALLDVSYRYLTTLFAAEYQHSLYVKRGWGIHALAQPHFVMTLFNVNDQDPVDQWGREFGINLGLVVERHLGDGRAAIYGGVSSGPHFLEKETHRQTSGPIFSSALFFGCTFRVSRHIVLDLRPGFRHISNAGIYIPNGGINNSTLNTGIFYHF
jgi:hypothetical protein